jgi:hypothetical protein
MILTLLKTWFTPKPEAAAQDTEHKIRREELRIAGLREEDLRKMDPDDRVALLEQARLDPYDYIYLAC